MASKGMDPLGQFTLTTGFGPIGHVVNFTNSNEMMLLAAAIIVGTMATAASARAVVPGRLQGVVEIFYEFTDRLVVDTIGPEGRRFFPFVFLIFSFILVGNLLGLFPYFFPFTSHIAVTFSIALFIFVLATVLGFVFQGVRFLKLFAPEGVPKWLLPLLVPIEVITYFTRPISLSVRLFANITAGHVMWEVFAGFMLLLTASLGFVGILASVIPLALNFALTALEFLVAVLQAYVFAVLTCLYLNDAVHGH